MKARRVKELFKRDFENNFYQFDGSIVHRNLKLEFFGNQVDSKVIKVTKVNYLLSIAKLFAYLLIIPLFLITLFFILANNDEVKVDEFFKAADVEYNPEPVVVLSSTKGEVISIYEGIPKGLSSSEKQYFYYYSGKGSINIDHLFFINRDKSLKAIHDLEDPFGNLSDLISINPNNNIQIVIVYDNNKVYSKFFVAIE